MSPLGKFLLNWCGQDLKIDLNRFPLLSEQYKMSKPSINNYARKLGLTVREYQLHTQIGMAPVKGN